MKMLNIEKKCIYKICMLHSAEAVKTYNSREIETHLQLLEEAIKFKTSMIMDAAQIISFISSEDKNYTEVWTLVRRKFDNKHLIFQTLMYKLFSQPMEQSESPKVVKALIYNTNKHVRAL